MAEIKHIGQILKHNKYNNDNNVNVNNSNNVNNDSNGTSYKDKKYALDRDSFNPHTEETQLAEKIATSFDDLQNYAFYRFVVNELGVSGAYVFWNVVQQEIEEKRGSKYEIRNPKKYFAWKFKKGLHQ